MPPITIPPTTLTPPLNIFTGCREQNGLGAALTNLTTLSQRKGTITRPYPVRFRDVEYPDAESAFQQLHSQHRKLPAPQADLDLMVSILIAKFQQHPRLLLAVAAKGGVPWLETCEHRTGARTPAYQWWEGRGRESPMIAVLIEAYGRALVDVLGERF